MLDPAIAILLALSFTALFAGGAIGKLRDLGRFVEAFGSYELLAPSVRPLIARLLPFAELAVALALLSTALRGFAAIAGGALLIAYALAITINLRRGRHDLACGCGGPRDRQLIAAWMVWRNAVLAAVLVLVALPQGTRSLQTADFITIGGGVITAAALYMGFDQLLGHVAPRTATLRQPTAGVTR